MAFRHITPYNAQRCKPHQSRTQQRQSRAQQPSARAHLAVLHRSHDVGCQRHAVVVRRRHAAVVAPHVGAGGLLHSAGAVQHSCAAHDAVRCAVRVHAAAGLQLPVWSEVTRHVLAREVQLLRRHRLKENESALGSILAARHTRRRATHAPHTQAHVQYASIHAHAAAREK
jgi:hypothetical protein